MKRFLCLLLSLLLTLSLCACGQQAADRTAGMDPAATATDENGETISYSTSYYVDTGDWIPAYYNRHFSMCGDVISFPLEDGKILQFLNLDDLKGHSYSVRGIWDEGRSFHLFTRSPSPELDLPALNVRTINVMYRDDTDFSHEKAGLQIGETIVRDDGSSFTALDINDQRIVNLENFENGNQSLQYMLPWEKGVLILQVSFEDASPTDPQVQEYMIALLEELAADHIKVIRDLSEDEMAPISPGRSSFLAASSRTRCLPFPVTG